MLDGDQRSTSITVLWRTCRSRAAALWIANVLLLDAVALYTLSEAKRCAIDLSNGIALFGNGAVHDARFMALKERYSREAAQCIAHFELYALLMLFCSLMAYLLFQDVRRTFQKDKASMRGAVE